jgi:hypothetical protein
VWKGENESDNKNETNIGAKKKGESNELNKEKRKEEIAKRRRI